MTTTYAVKVECPPMAITQVNRKLRLTSAEPMVVTISGGATFDVAVFLVIPNVLIPPTDVRKITLMHWKVDACVGKGTDFEGNTVEIDLPIEDVLFTEESLTMLINGEPLTVFAQPINSPLTLKLKDGRIGKGSVLFPEDAEDVAKSEAAACVAIGTVTFP